MVENARKVVQSQKNNQRNETSQSHTDFGPAMEPSPRALRGAPSVGRTGVAQLVLIKLQFNILEVL